MYDNTIMNSKSHSNIFNNSSNGNTFYSNKLISANKDGLEIDQDATSKDNVFSNNQVINSASSNSTVTPEIQKRTER